MFAIGRGQYLKLVGFNIDASQHTERLTIDVPIPGIVQDGRVPKTAVSAYILSQ
ncbi:hypothetical protein D3C81_2334790 [compost metagenome]